MTYMWIGPQTANLFYPHITRSLTTNIAKFMQPRYTHIPSDICAKNSALGSNGPYALDFYYTEHTCPLALYTPALMEQVSWCRWAKYHTESYCCSWVALLGLFYLQIAGTWNHFLVPIGLDFAHFFFLEVNCLPVLQSRCCILCIPVFPVHINCISGKFCKRYMCCDST